MNKHYADAYTIASLGISFNECEIEGYTEYTNTEVYSVPAKYQNILPKSLRLVGCFGDGGDNGIFTEK